MRCLITKDSARRKARAEYCVYTCVSNKATFRSLYDYTLIALPTHFQIHTFRK